MQLNADWAGETVLWLRQRKVHLRPLFDAHGIEHDALKFGRQVDARHFAAILEFGAEAVGDPHFGLTRGGAFHIKNGGVLAYIAASAKTVGEAVDGLQRYVSVVCDGLSSETKRERDGVRLITRAADPTWRQCRHLGEFGTARMIGALRALTGVALSPLEVRFMHPHGVAVAECRRFFGCPVEYGGGADAVRFSNEVLEIPIPTANSRLGAILRAYADELLQRVRAAPAGSLEERVQALIADRLSSGRFSLRDVARELGLSERTLRRRLNETGTSFNELVSRKRLELAQDWLSGTDFDLKHISFLLGYSEPAAFSRAFKRSTGKTPGHHRESGAVTRRDDRTRARPSGRAGA